MQTTYYLCGLRGSSLIDYGSCGLRIEVFEGVCMSVVHVTAVSCVLPYGVHASDAMIFSLEAF